MVALLVDGPRGLSSSRIKSQWKMLLQELIFAEGSLLTVRTSDYRARDKFIFIRVLLERWIGSSAYCTIDRTAPGTVILVGTTQLNSGGQTYAVQEIINHENYIPILKLNEVSALRTFTEIIYSAAVQPIALSPQFIGGGLNVRGKALNLFLSIDYKFDISNQLPDGEQSMESTKFTPTIFIMWHCKPSQTLIVVLD